MIDSYFRAPYDRLVVKPVLKAIAPLSSLSPKACTYTGLALGIAIAPALYLKLNILAFILLICSGYLDTLDGALARAKRCASPRGAALDIFADRAVETAVVFGLFARASESNGWMAILMLGSILLCVTSFLVVGIFTKNEGKKSFYYSPGIMERSEAFIFFAAMILFPSYFLFLSSLFCLLITLTGVFRMYQFLQTPL